MKYENSPEISKSVFDNGNYIKVHYKKMDEKRIIFHYSLKSVTGTMKVIPAWLPEYEDVLRQAECSLPYLFMPTILKYLHSVDLMRFTKLKTKIDLHDAGKLKELTKLDWTLNPKNGNFKKDIKDIRASLSWENKIVKELEKMIKEII